MSAPMKSIESPDSSDRGVSKPTLTFQIGEGDNKQLKQITQSQQNQLKESGILPELSIAGGTELDYLRTKFDKLDTTGGGKDGKGGDGKVTKKEIEDYLKTHNETLSKEEKETLQKLAQKVDKLEQNSKDADLIPTGEGAVYGPEGGISKKDVEVANQRLKAEDYANKKFDVLDANNDGHVNADEIKKYVKDNEGKLSADEKQNLNALIKDMDRLQSAANDEMGFENDGFTQRDLKVARTEDGTTGVKVAGSDFQYKKDPEKNPDGKGELPGQKPEPGKRAGDNPLVGDHEYVIKPGDSFWKISKDNLRAQNGKEPSNAEVVKAMNELAKANGMKLTDVIHPGQKLKVPGPDKGGHSENPVRRPDPEGGNRQRPERPEGRRPEPAMPEPGHRQPGQEREPAPKTQEFASQVLQRRFSEIDKDGNNKVNRKEIEKYLSDHAKDLSAEEVRALDMMARNESKIRTLVDDEKGPENSGMSRKDLQKLDEVQKVGSAMLNQGMFNGLDESRNGFLSKEEITKALTTRRLSPQERVTLEFLKDNLKILQTGVDDERGPENNGVSQADLRYFASLK